MKQLTDAAFDGLAAQAQHSSRRRVTERTVLGEDCRAASTWHAVLSLDQGGIIFEVKQGPYMPVGEADRAPWAAGRLAEELNAWYANARVGDCFA